MPRDEVDAAFRLLRLLDLYGLLHRLRRLLARQHGDLVHKSRLLRQDSTRCGLPIAVVVEHGDEVERIADLVRQRIGSAMMREYAPIATGAAKHDDAGSAAFRTGPDVAVFVAFLEDELIAFAFKLRSDPLEAMRLVEGVDVAGRSFI